MAKKALIAALAAALLISLPFVLKGVNTKTGASSVKISENNGAYQLIVDGKPYLVRGVCYNPRPVGKDYEFNFWGDAGKPWLIDGALMKKAGINTVRLYRTGKDPDQTRKVINELYTKFGIRSLVGSYLGFWSWPPPNYSDAAFRQKIRTEVLEMVRLYKDSPGVLMWVLGNENNYSFDRNVQRWSNAEIDAMTDKNEQKRAMAKIYYSYINALALEIKKIDPNHPVVMGVGETGSLEYAKEFAPDIDVIGMISYRGSSFGNLFRQIKQKFDKPVVMIEWGADSLNASTRQADESSQANFIKLQWQEIEKNASTQKGVGNSLGGTVFEWSDEWWKGNENLPNTWTIQDTAAHWNNASYYYDSDVPGGMNMNEEWWGIVALDPENKDNGMDARVPKKSYQVLQSLWASHS